MTIKPDILVDETPYIITATTSNGGCFVSSPFNTSSSAEYNPLTDMDLQSMLQESARAPPAPSTQIVSSFLNPITIGSTVAAAVSVIGAYKLSQHIAGSKNRKDHCVVFFFTSVIFVSIIIWVVSAIWSPVLAAM